jgi:hypothetical protein
MVLGGAGLARHEYRAAVDSALFRLSLSMMTLLRVLFRMVDPVGLRSIGAREKSGIKTGSPFGLCESNHGIYRFHITWLGSEKALPRRPSFRYCLSLPNCCLETLASFNTYQYGYSGKFSFQ